MEDAAMELLRAIRGARSQIAFARRLGYKRNPICDWEHGRRFPTGEEALRAAAVVGIDVAGAFRRFATADAPPPESFDTPSLAAWLARLRGATPIAEIADRAGTTRFVVSRWLSGSTRPRLPDFLRLIEALTRRTSDLVAALVPIEAVPALLRDWQRREDGRRLALEVPWSGAVLRLLETTEYQALPVHRPGWLAERLGIDAGTEATSIDALQRAGIVAWDGARYATGAAATIDTRGTPEVVAALKAHWAQVGQQRTLAPRHGDLLSYNVISLSRADLARLREMHLAYYRAVRALVAGSEPVEVAALVNVQLVTFDPPTPGS